MSSLARGARLGIDVGQARVGVAASDPDGLVATPVETVARAGDDPLRLIDSVRRIVAIAQELSATVAYVGLPRHLSGAEGPASADARAFAAALVNAFVPFTPAVEVRMVDERMSTVTAQQELRASGRAARRQRAVVDQAAAVVILRTALEHERLADSRPGEVVEQRVEHS